MSAWQSLNEDDFWKKVRELALAVHASEWDACDDDLRLWYYPGAPHPLWGY